MRAALARWRIPSVSHRHLYGKAALWPRLTASLVALPHVGDLEGARRFTSGVSERFDRGRLGEQFGGELRELRTFENGSTDGAPQHGLTVARHVRRAVDCARIF